jgi:hypothetical protein
MIGTCSVCQDTQFWECRENITDLHVIEYNGTAKNLALRSFNSGIVVPVDPGYRRGQQR